MPHGSGAAHFFYTLSIQPAAPLAPFWDHLLQAHLLITSFLSRAPLDFANFHINGAFLGSSHHNLANFQIKWPFLGSCNETEGYLRHFCGVSVSRSSSFYSPSFFNRTIIAFPFLPKCFAMSVTELPSDHIWRSSASASSVQGSKAFGCSWRQAYTE